jgi:hypothetical protein
MSRGEGGGGGGGGAGDLKESGVRGIYMRDRKRGVSLDIYFLVWAII